MSFLVLSFCWLEKVVRGYDGCRVATRWLLLVVSWHDECFGVVAAIFLHGELILTSALWVCPAGERCY